MDIYRVPNKNAAPVNPGILRYHSHLEPVNSTLEMQGIPLNMTISAPYSQDTETKFWILTCKGFKIIVTNFHPV